MKRSLTFAGVILSAVVATPAIAGEYGAANLGGSTYLTWGFTETTPIPRGGTEPSLRGYACVTQDALEAMSRTAIIHRYQILLAPGGDDFYLSPVGGVAVTRSATRLVATDSTPEPEQAIWDIAETDVGGWFKSELPPEGMGLACVNSGIAGAMQYLERVHNSR